MTSAKQYFLIPSELMREKNQGEQGSTYSKRVKGQLVVGYNCKREGKL